MVHWHAKTEGDVAKQFDPGAELNEAVGSTSWRCPVVPILIAGR
jgi:hypothetical protein